jgi:hypothetical protein
MPPYKTLLLRRSGVYYSCRLRGYECVELVILPPDRYQWWAVEAGYLSSQGTQDGGLDPGRNRLFIRAKKSTACIPSEGK